MSHRQASTSLGCFLLLLLVPLCASAAPKDPCKLLQRDLDQQIDDLKAWQKLDLQECFRVSGSDSDACRQLQDRHAQDLRMFRDNRTYQMANCRGNQPRSVAAASPFENNNHDLNDFYEKYYKNRGPCVEYPYVNCQQYDHYVHAKLHHHHHHHYYSDPASGGVKSASAYAEKPSSVSATGHADHGAKQGARVNDASGHEYAAQSAHRGSDHRDSAPNHHSGHGDSSSTTSSSHNHDSGGASYSGGSHASGGSAASSGSSSSGTSHSSGGGGSTSSPGSSSSGASQSAPASSGNSAASAASPASSPSHDSGGSRPH